mgnify:CR=1 FL=1
MESRNNLTKLADNRQRYQILLSEFEQLNSEIATLQKKIEMLDLNNPDHDYLEELLKEKLILKKKNEIILSNPENLQD